MVKKKKKKPDCLSWRSRFLLQIPKVIRGTNGRKKPGKAKTHHSGEQKTRPQRKHTRTHTGRALRLPGAAPRRLPWGGFILTLLGWVVGVRLVVCGGWGRGRLLVAPVAN